MSLQTHKLISTTDRYAVIGNPITHSQSPFIHQKFAEQTHQQLEYERLYSPLDKFIDIVKQFQLTGGKGVNVTLPFKHLAFTMAQQSSEAAQIAQAANTLKFCTDGSIYADNTDGLGLITDIIKNLHLSLKDKKILIIGAGGATCGILGPLLQQKPSLVIIANRTIEKAVALVKQFASLGLITSCRLEFIPPGPYDFIFNATSISLSSQSFNVSAEGLIYSHTCCYDLAYSSQPTSFMHWGKLHGANQCFDGLGMLVEQAAAAFFLWRHIHPHTSPVIAALKTHLQK